MPDSSDDERDSRTAAVGVSRSQSNSSASTSRGRAKDRAGRKKGNMKDLQDLIPRGGSFTTTPLDVDQDDATSSSGSESSDNEKEDVGNNNTTKPTTQNQGPAINWNQASRSAIRTTLGKRKAAPVSTPAQEKSAFDAVNDKYFRSRSASESDDESQADDVTKVPNSREGEGSQPTSYFVDDSEGSESGEISEGGDSMMLNIGQEDGAQHNDDGSGDASFFFDTTPAQIPTETQVDNKAKGLSNGATAETKGEGIATSKKSPPLRSKAAALAELASRYETAPATLADLKHNDLQIQMRYFFANRRNDEIDLSLPISCTECLQNGHLALVCPSKECQHCGVWDLHEDRLCPTVRRCQKCREIGHDAQDCHSPLKSSAAETPCEFCGADTHLEFDCDKLWKFPHLQALEAPIKVSISCSYCTNKNHLLGDCPLKKVPTTSSTFTLKSYDPSSITNLNSILGPRKADQQKGMRSRGQPPPQDDDNMLALHNPPAQRSQGGRGKIQIKGLASNRNLGGGPPPLPREPPPPGPPPFQPRDYRDRDQGYHYRERSRSPRLPSKPPSNFSQGNRKPPPPRGGRNGGGGRGRGRGRDQYRPGRP